MDLKLYEGKRVFVKLISGRVYSGVIEAVDFLGHCVDNDGEFYLFTMLDKFGLYVSFSNKEIASIQIERGEEI